MGRDRRAIIRSDMDELAMKCLNNRLTYADYTRISLWWHFWMEYALLVECQYERKYEGYSWCDLSDNPCFKDTSECQEFNEAIKDYFNA